MTASIQHSKRNPVAQVVKDLKARLSLRAPQAESLEKLDLAIQNAKELLTKQGRDTEVNEQTLAKLQTVFPTLADFERDFPSICFSLATGVGKTRLMGAFIAYLHLAYGINNFFVLAPNLTIYEKLITDFTPNTPKYVFANLAQFNFQSPMIITGDNYDSRDTATASLLGQIRINVFNISKINSEVRGGKGRARERARSFNIFREEMRMASKGMPSALGDLGREKVKVFWRYTQNIWQKSNVPPNKRLETIMQAYGAESLSELFDTIMQRNEKVLEYAKNMKMHTGELEDYTDVDGGSPIWLLAVSPDVIR